MAADNLAPSEVTALLGGMLRTAAVQEHERTMAAERDEKLLAFVVAVPLECKAPEGVRIHIVFSVVDTKVKLVDFIAGEELNEQTRQKLAALHGCEGDHLVSVQLLTNTIESRRYSSRESDLRNTVLDPRLPVGLPRNACQAITFALQSWLAACGRGVLPSTDAPCSGTMAAMAVDPFLAQLVLCEEAGAARVAEALVELAASNPVRFVDTISAALASSLRLAQLTNGRGACSGLWTIPVEWGDAHAAASDSEIMQASLCRKSTMYRRVLVPLWVERAAGPLPAARPPGHASQLSMEDGEDRTAIPDSSGGHSGRTGCGVGGAGSGASRTAATGEAGVRDVAAHAEAAHARLHGSGEKPPVHSGWLSTKADAFAILRLVRTSSPSPLALGRSSPSSMPTLAAQSHPPISGPAASPAGVLHHLPDADSQSADSHGQEPCGRSSVSTTTDSLSSSGSRHRSQGRCRLAYSVESVVTPSVARVFARMAGSLPQEAWIQQPEPLSQRFLGVLVFKNRAGRVFPTKAWRSLAVALPEETIAALKAAELQGMHCAASGLYLACGSMPVKVPSPLLVQFSVRSNPLWEVSQYRKALARDTSAHLAEPSEDASRGAGRAAGSSEVETPPSQPPTTHVASASSGSLAGGSHGGVPAATGAPLERRAFTLSSSISSEGGQSVGVADVDPSPTSSQSSATRVSSASASAAAPGKKKKKRRNKNRKKKGGGKRIDRFIAVAVTLADGTYISETSQQLSDEHLHDVLETPRGGDGEALVGVGHPLASAPMASRSFPVLRTEQGGATPLGDAPGMDHRQFGAARGLASLRSESGSFSNTGAITVEDVESMSGSSPRAAGSPMHARMIHIASGPGGLPWNPPRSVPPHLHTRAAQLQQQQQPQPRPSAVDAHGERWSSAPVMRQYHPPPGWEGPDHDTIGSGASRGRPKERQVSVGPPGMDKRDWREGGGREQERGQEHFGSLVHPPASQPPYHRSPATAPGAPATWENPSSNTTTTSSSSSSSSSSTGADFREAPYGHPSQQWSFYGQRASQPPPHGHSHGHHSGQVHLFRNGDGRSPMTGGEGPAAPTDVPLAYQASRFPAMGVPRHRPAPPPPTPLPAPGHPRPLPLSQPPPLHAQAMRGSLHAPQHQRQQGYAYPRADQHPPRPPTYGAIAHLSNGRTVIVPIAAHEQARLAAAHAAHMHAQSPAMGHMAGDTDGFVSPSPTSPASSASLVPNPAFDGGSGSRGGGGGGGGGVGGGGVGGSLHVRRAQHGYPQASPPQQDAGQTAPRGNEAPAQSLPRHQAAARDATQRTSSWSSGHSSTGALSAFPDVGEDTGRIAGARQLRGGEPQHGGQGRGAGGDMEDGSSLSHSSRTANSVPLPAPHWDRGRGRFRPGGSAEQPRSHSDALDMARHPTEQASTESVIDLTSALAEPDAASSQGREDGYAALAGPSQGMMLTREQQHPGAGAYGADPSRSETLAQSRSFSGAKTRQSWKGRAMRPLAASEPRMVPSSSLRWRGADTREGYHASGVEDALDELEDVVEMDEDGLNALGLPGQSYSQVPSLGIDASGNSVSGHSSETTPKGRKSRASDFPGGVGDD